MLNREPIQTTCHSEGNVKVSASTLYTACEFISTIGTDASGITMCVMQTIGSELVLFATANGAVAEYRIENFQGRLIGPVIVDLRTLHAVAKEIDDEADVVIFEGNHGEEGTTRHKFCAGTSVFGLCAFVPNRRSGVIEADDRTCSVIPVNGEEVRNAIWMVEDAVGRAGDQDNLRGVCIDVTVERFAVVATNGSHLACWQKRRQKEDEDHILPVGRGVIPSQYVSLARATVEGGGAGTVSISESSIDIRCGRRHCVIPQPIVFFPHWRRSIELMPPAYATVSIFAGDIHSALNEAKGASDRDNAVVGIHGEHEWWGKKTTITFEVMDDVECTIERQCTTQAEQFGPAYVAIGFLRKAMGKISDDEKVRLLFRKNQNEPIEIRSGNFLAYVMPMRREGSDETEGGTKTLETAGGAV